ncbi:hypothetical protein KYB31_09270 [Clostridium felsineum]|uniref:hypothetical protein n=1 Tax=Clostridium felsineum TaxID=36839 RepID=UPI00214D7A38|nr:hypothetical protein [Clostridium felsineum]MCR3759178.1 hypothetical protein [Clostridium felsineum]
MFGRKYRYFVIYKIKKGEETGFGSAEVERKKKIKYMEDIRGLEKQLSEERELDWCCIINFILL